MGSNALPGVPAHLFPNVGAASPTWLKNADFGLEIVLNCIVVSAKFVVQALSVPLAPGLIGGGTVWITNSVSLGEYNVGIISTVYVCLTVWVSG